MYLALVPKPGNGGEIQNLAKIASGIMLCLKVVKSAIKEKVIVTNAIVDDDNIANANEAGKRVQLLLELELTGSWHHSDHLIMANTYFTSVEAALGMKEQGLTFIGNVKQTSRQFPMEFLGNTTLSRRGSRAVLMSVDQETGKTKIIAISWVDRNQQILWLLFYALSGS